ncbi:hypothetical protein BC829DRAFT_207838 [Chytridium lagenaria]|nr:hypothetical protein BC829DRAFT_207838 [Chytridium lagenaria]
MQEALALTLEQFQAGGQLTLSHVPSARHSTANLCEREEPDMKSAVLELPLDNFDIKSAVLELPLDNLPAFKSSPSLGNDLKGAGNVKSSKVHLNVPERQDTTLQKRISRQYMYMPKFNANGSIASLHPSKLFPSNTVLNLGVSSESLTREKGPKNRFFIGIHPRSVFASVWDVFMTGVYCTLIWFVPISTCFEKNAHLEPFVAGVSTCMFALDIIKILLTKRIRIDRNNAIKDKKVHPAGKSAFNGVARDEVEVLLSLRESQRQYLGRIFFLDILYTIPWNLILRGHIPNAWLLLFVKMFRLWRLPVLLKTTPHFLYLRRNIEISLGGGRTLWNLAVLLTCLLAFLHLEGCLFFLIGRLTNYANSPLADSIGSTLLDQYAEAMFYAVSNTVPVAFKPSDAAHQWVILILAMSGAALYAMIIGTVSSFTNSFDASGKIYRQKMDELNDYMNWKCLPDELRTKMRHYYALKYRGKFFEESSLLETLNESLRNEIAVHNCKELIDQVPFLQRSVDDGRSDSFVGRIAKSMVACFYVKGDVICTEGEMGMEMYFIVSGQVNVIVNKRQCAVLKGGQFFGELSMVAMIPRTATIIAGAPSVLYKLNRDNFIPILQDFDDVREKVAEIYKERIERLKLEEAARTLPDSSFPGTSTITNTETPYTTRVPVILQASSQMDPTFLLSTESLLRDLVLKRRK